MPNETAADGTSTPQRVFEDVMRFGAPDADSPFVEHELDMLFGQVWARGGISRRERRLLTLAVATVLGQQGAIEMHLRAALENGELSAEDAQEVILHLAYYAGWPLAGQMHFALRKVAARSAR